MTRISILCSRCLRQWKENGLVTEHSARDRRCPWPKDGTVFQMKESTAFNLTCNGELSVVVRRVNRRG